MDLTELRKLEQFVDDASFVRNIAQIKQENKERFATWVERTHGLKLNTRAMFDIHVKRIHEYKVSRFFLIKIWKIYIQGSPTGMAPNF